MANAKSSGTEDDTAHVQQLLDELLSEPGERTFALTDRRKAAIQKALDATPGQQVQYVRRCVDIVAHLVRNRTTHPGMAAYVEPAYPHFGVDTVGKLLRRKLPLTGEDLVFLVERTVDGRWELEGIRKVVLSQVDRYLKDHPPSPELCAALKRFEKLLETYPNRESTTLKNFLQALPLSESREVPLKAGEAWSNVAIDDVNQSSDPAAWCNLLHHCRAATSGTPTKKWDAEADRLLDKLGRDVFVTHILRWFPLVDEPALHRTVKRFGNDNDLMCICDENGDVLKGLAWFCGRVAHADVARALTSPALSSYRKLPEIGPRLLRVGNACIHALGQLPGREAIGELAILKVKVSNAPAIKAIEKALAAAAEREGLPPEEIEEISVPAYGLTEVGRLVETIGDYTAEVTIAGSASTELAWIKDSKRQKSVPASIKKDFAEELKELKNAVKDIEKMLPAQRDRIDGLYLHGKTWPLDVWRERYLDHPLVGVIARQLIWTFETGNVVQAGLPGDNRFIDVDGKEFAPGSTAQVKLWHPLESSTDEVLAWRCRLEDEGIQQPFKQAHREVYVLTGAERKTRVYSNRFASHIVRQHQFHALCGIRGWRNRLRLMFDDVYPPTHKRIPHWKLRAEFWVEGTGDQYGVDSNESGVYLWLATDQVRFYPIDSAQRLVESGGGGYMLSEGETEPDPVPLEQIPAIVFSEIMRDVDLFVGVASVGNDPTWFDGGPEGRHANYWQSYSFGELSTTASTRRDALSRLLPKLKIGSRCELTDRFLVVRGDLREYKIHLGSGNILMSPDDRYLCIVPKAEMKAGDKVMLPFEGDRMLSIILSKAFLLAEDKKIKDPTIVSQIRP